MFIQSIEATAIKDKMCSKRLFTPTSSPESSPQPSKIPKSNSLQHLQSSLSKALDNLDTHLSAAAYKLSRKQANEGKEKIDLCVNIVSAMKKQSKFQTDAALRDYYSMSQRIIGLEKNTAYLRKEVKRLKMQTSVNDEEKACSGSSMKLEASQSVNPLSMDTPSVDTPEKQLSDFLDDDDDDDALFQHAE